VSKLLVGSVAEQVLRSAAVPVITAGPEAHPPVEGAGLERVVLHATNLGEASRTSAALACQIAATLEAKLVLLHVLPPVDEMQRKGLPTGLDSAAVRELHAMAIEAGSRCSTLIEALAAHGNPSIEILAAASERHADLIVLGATQRSMLETLTRDRTVYKVLAHAHCPVLTLREPRAEREEGILARLAAHT
jgi:nucleotide-binding universal stress UspA family protein